MLSCLRLVVASMIEITQKPVSLESVVNRVRKDSCGAVVTFIGTVRDSSYGRKVLSLEYEAYEKMAKDKFGDIVTEIGNKWQLQDIAICHRVGKVKVGEIVLVIAVAAAHRQEAFEACRYAIDRLKQIAPIWKKEIYEDGTSWIESPA